MTKLRYMVPIIPPLLGEVILDKTHVQYAWLTYFKLYNFIPKDLIRNNNKHKPMASNRYKIEDNNM